MKKTINMFMLKTKGRYIMVKEISKTEAKKLYEQGITVGVSPCNKGIKDTMFMSPLDTEYSFERNVQFYTYHDCNKIDGKRLKFYTET